MRFSWYHHQSPITAKLAAQHAAIAALATSTGSLAFTAEAEAGGAEAAPAEKPALLATDFWQGDPTGPNPTPEPTEPTGLRSNVAAALWPLGTADFGREALAVVVAVPGRDSGGGEVGMYSDGELAHRVDGCEFEYNGDFASDDCLSADVLALGEPRLL